MQSPSRKPIVLFHHTLDYQDKMIQLVTRSQEAIQGLHDCIWDVIHHVMEKAGRSTADGLEIALCLVDMLPSIPLHLTFHTAIADLPRFTPEALTYALPPHTIQDAMSAPGEETLASAHSAEVQAVQSTGHTTVTHTESVKPLMSRSKGGKDPNIPGTSISPVTHMSSFACWCPPRHQTPRSPSYSPSRSQSPHRRVEESKPRSRLHTSDSSTSTLSNSSSTESESDSEHLGATPTVRSDAAPVHRTSSS